MWYVIAILIIGILALLVIRFMVITSAQILAAGIIAVTGIIKAVQNHKTRAATLPQIRSPEIDRWTAAERRGKIIWWLLISAIFAMCATISLLGGCASAPPAAVSEVYAPQYAQRPASKPYCDDACQAQKNVVRPRERAQAAQPQHVSSAQEYENLSHIKRWTDYAKPKNAKDGYLAMLPNLSRPVYLKKGALVCKDISGLANNPASMIFLGYCALNKAPRRVSVILPDYGQRKGDLAYWKAADIVDDDANDTSDATLYGGVVYIRCLTNTRTNSLCPTGRKE